MTDLNLCGNSIQQAGLYVSAIERAGKLHNKQPADVPIIIVVCTQDPLLQAYCSNIPHLTGFNGA